MKISIQNFRCFRKLTSYEFMNNKVSLLKGNSGAGKSTLLEAIRWCLYGNLRNIYPSGFTPSPTNKTCVILEINNLKITRSQSPEQLKVEILNSENKSENKSNTELTQASAQDYIDGQFGNKNVWLSSSFIRQGERCPLMTASNADRMTLLNEILFGSDSTSPYENPDYYTEKIEEELEKVVKSITGETAIFNSSYTKYVSALNSYVNKYEFKDITESDVRKYMDLYSNAKLEIDNVNRKLIFETTLEKQRELLMNRIANISESSRIPVNENEVKLTYEKLMNIISTENEHKTKLNELMLQKSKFNALQNELITQQSRYKPEICVNTTKDLKQKRESLRENLVRTKNLYTTIQSDELQLSNVNFKLESLLTEKVSNDKSLSVYEYTDITLLNSILQNKILENKLSEIESNIAKIKTEFDENIKSLTDTEITARKREIEIKILELRQAMSICNKYGLNLTTVKQQIVKIQEILDFDKLQKQHLQNATQHRNVMNEITKLKALLSPLNSDSELSIPELKSKIESIRIRMGKPLKCPCCDVILELKNNILVKPESEIIDTHKGLNEIEELNKLIEKITHNDKINVSINNLEQRLSLIEKFDEDIVNKPVYDASHITHYTNLINEVSRVNLDSLQSLSLTELEANMENLVNLEKYNTLQNSKLELLSRINPTLISNLSVEQLRQNIATIPLYLSKRDSLNLEIAKLQPLQISLQNKLKECSSSTELRSSIESLEKEMSDLESLYKSVEEQELILQRINAINNELESLKLSLNQNEKNETLEQSLKESLIKLEKEKLSLETLYSEQKRALSEYSEYIALQNECSKIIIEKGSKYYTELIESLNGSIKEYEAMYKSANEYLTLSNQRVELEGLHKKVSDLTHRQAYLNYIKSVIVEVANNTLQSLVDNINNTCNTILENLFDTSMIIELKLYKELKAKQKIKPQVNISIYYNGNTYDNISSLSGGEADRVSLALTLALGTIHTSPLILLDECMSALNLELKEDCIETIQKFLTIENNKTVINIEHAAIDGMYDDTVSI